MKTRLTELLGIEVPIICGGMMRVGTAELAAAVSNAGALGILTALSQPTPERLKAEIQKCQALTDKPFGVNITVGVVTTPLDYSALIDVIVKSGVKIVETAGRSPEPFMPYFKAAGIKVIHKAVTVRHAMAAERIGVDVISIDGFECAGHPGEQDVGGLVLFPATAQSLRIPVVASGGIERHSPHLLRYIQRMLAPKNEGPFETLETLLPTLEPVLKNEVAARFLPWMEANQQAFEAGQKETQLTMNGQLFRQKTFKYQVNTLNELRRKFSTVADTTELVGLLDKTGCMRFLEASK